MKSTFTSQTSTGKHLKTTCLERWPPVFHFISESNVGVAIIFGTAFGLFTIMMIIIIASIVCRQNQGTNQNIFPMGHLTHYFSCGRGREKNVPQKKTTSTRERAFSQSTVVPSFTCIETTEVPLEEKDTAPSEGERLLGAGSIGGVPESLSVLTDIETRSTSSDTKTNDSEAKLKEWFVYVYVPINNMFSKICYSSQEIREFSRNRKLKTLKSHAYATVFWLKSFLNKLYDVRNKKSGS